MESIKSHRDLMTRDRTNAVDDRRPDSGHKGQLAWKSGWMNKHLPPPETVEPSKVVKQMKNSFDKLSLPPGIREMGDAGLYGLELGTRLHKYV